MTEIEALKILNGESENSNNIYDVQIALRIAAKALEEIQTYRANQSIAVPCKPGDRVWVLFRNCYAECEVTGLTLTKHPNIGLDLWVIDEERPIQGSSSEFGFSIFCTKEEAEQAFEEQEAQKER